MKLYNTKTKQIRVVSSACVGGDWVPYGTQFDLTPESDVAPVSALEQDLEPEPVIDLAALGDLTECTVPDLKEIALDLGVDLAGKTRKDEIIETIQAAAKS